jgi:hypothetical protein
MNIILQFYPPQKIMHDTKNQEIAVQAYLFFNTETISEELVNLYGSCCHYGTIHRARIINFVFT